MTLAKFSDDFIDNWQKDQASYHVEAMLLESLLNDRKELVNKLERAISIAEKLKLGQNLQK